MLICRECRQEKSAGEYYRNKDVPLLDCKECHKEKVRRRRLTNPCVRAYDRDRSKLPHRVQLRTRVTKEWRDQNPQAYKAQTTLGNALRDGKITREPCAICSATDQVHAHHKDYAKPLAVIWLCARCHHRLHALFPELEGINRVFACVGN